MSGLAWTLVLGVLYAVAVASVFVFQPWQPRKFIPPTTREVVVLCRDESSFGGVELRRDATGILLAAPKVLPDDGPPVPLAHDLHIPADNIRAIQIITHVEAREPVVGLQTERQWRRRA